MPSPWRPYEIHPLAWRRWEDYDVPFLMSDVIDAVLALPAGKRVDGVEIVPVVKFDSTEGEVFGRRFRIVGVKDHDGRWELILRVKLVERGEA